MWNRLWSSVRNFNCEINLSHTPARTLSISNVVSIISRNFEKSEWISLRGVINTANNNIWWVPVKNKHEKWIEWINHSKNPQFNQNSLIQDKQHYYIAGKFLQKYAFWRARIAVAVLNYPPTMLTLSYFAFSCNTQKRKRNGNLCFLSLLFTALRSY